MLLGGDRRWLVTGLAAGLVLGTAGQSAAAGFAAPAFQLRLDRQPAFLAVQPASGTKPPILLAQAAAPAGAVPEAADSPPDFLRFEVRNYHIEGNTLLPPQDIARELAPYTGPRRDFGDVQRALETLQALYQKKGYAGVQVSLPEQELDRGEVTLRVIEVRIGRVLVEGNEHFSADLIRRSVPSLQPGTTPMTRQISASVRVANENPARQSAVLLRPAPGENEVDAVIRVADVPPMRFSLSLDNTGNRETGFYRSGFAFQHANLLGRDHVLTAQYITSPQNTNDVEVYGLGYRVPLYARGDSMDFIAGYSTVNSGTVQGLFDVSGKGAIYAFRYNNNLSRLGEIEHRLVYGIDYRAYQNLVTPVGGGFNFVPDVTVHPASVTYSAQLRQERREASFYLSYARNLPGGNDGRAENFQNSRRDARASYRIWRAGSVFSGSFAKDWQYRVKVDLQYTDEALISPEQFGLGGADSVRGFNERYASSDKGLRSNWEIYTPELGTAMGFDKAKLRLLAFYDTGQLVRNFTLPGELERVSLDSAGFGARLSYGHNLTIKADYAQVLHDGSQFGTPAGRIYANRWHLLIGYVF
jgi:hemolysin activation/secretion protein